MPIRAEQRALYPADWKQISAAVREEAGQKCERCLAPNREMILRGDGVDAGLYMLSDGETRREFTGEFVGYRHGSEFDGRLVRIVLTVAHLDHDPTNNDRANLRALCQRCHLAHDAKHHARNAAATRRARKASGDLLDPARAAPGRLP